MIEPGSEVDMAINLIVDRVFNGPGTHSAAVAFVDPYNGEHMAALGARTALRAAGVTDPPGCDDTAYGPWYGVEPHPPEIR